MIIQNNSLEVLRECHYERNDKLNALVSNNLYLSIVATNSCQCKCPYCINSLTDMKLSLPIDKAKRNIERAVNEFGIKEAVIIGGEPTLYKDLFDLIEFLKSTGIRKFGLTTNGIRLKDSNFLKQLIKSDINFINVSFHKPDEFLTWTELEKIRKEFLQWRNPQQKMRINTNVWKNNHDTIDSLNEFINRISNRCDEIRISNIIHKDEFSVNSVAVDEAEQMYMTDEEYESLFSEFINGYADKYTIIHNPAALGFVNYYLIPTKTAIIVNWNINSKVSEQVCENNLGDNKIHTIKCLVNGDLSLSWNTGNTIPDDIDSFIKNKNIEQLSNIYY